ncbi:MAG: hypothetical protein R3E31_03325 [Chloroflexota bacterium]
MILLTSFIAKFADIRLLIFRLLVWRKGYLPWNYISFLKYATRRVILHQLGDDYIFTHPLLTDYIAELQIEGMPKLLERWVPPNDDFSDLF